jgi:hypothetical protein
MPLTPRVSRAVLAGGHGAALAASTATLWRRAGKIGTGYLASYLAEREAAR